MPGRCPTEYQSEFIQDVERGLTTAELAEKWKRSKRTLRSWRKKLVDAGLIESPAGAKRARAEKNTGEEEAPEPGLTWEETTNTASAQLTSTLVHTLDELLEAAAVDLNVWRVADWKVKAYPGFAKLKTGNLTFDSGLISGNLNYDGVGTVQLWSVWASLVRREPIEVTPAIKPVSLGAKYKPVSRPAPSRDAVLRALIGADGQIGFSFGPGGRLEPTHDRKALDLFVSLAQYLQPDVIALLGDMLDLTNWTDRFVRSPAFEATTQPALYEAVYFLRRLREVCPKARMEYHKGNHEQRIETQLAVHLREAFKLHPGNVIGGLPVLSLQNLLALDELGIAWVGNYPDDFSFLYPGLLLCHGDRALGTPGSTATAMLKDSAISVVYGHAHRREKASRRVILPSGEYGTVEAHGIGCLCRVDGATPGAKSRSNWQQGAAVIDYTLEGHTIYDIEFKNGRGVFDRGVFAGQDYTDELRQLVPGYTW